MHQNNLKRFFQEPQSSYFLFGPRGTGKSTWTQDHHKHALIVDFLSPEIYRQYTARPERLRDLLHANPHKRTIILDEIQRVPEVLSVVHSLIEEKKERQFILTGSSARKLKRAGVDLLAGRAIIRTLHPFMAAELGDQFELESALKWGLIPLIYDSHNPQEALYAYTVTYIQQEVQSEGLVRNIGDFARFLEVISFSHGEMLNVSNISRECEVERKTVEGYISILEDLLLGYKIPVFTKRAKRQLVSHPKLYLFDSGIYQILRPKGPLDSEDELNGHALEGLIAQHLRAWIGYSNSKIDLYFWRTRKGVEVDFILYGEHLFAAIEVKNSRRVFPKDVKPLVSFKEDYPECTCILLYRGKERMMVRGVLCIPCEEFLRQLHPSKPLI